MVRWGGGCTGIGVAFEHLSPLGILNQQKKTELQMDQTKLNFIENQELLEPYSASRFWYS